MNQSGVATNEGGDTAVLATHDLLAIIPPSSTTSGDSNPQELATVEGDSGPGFATGPAAGLGRFSGGVYSISELQSSSPSSTSDGSSWIDTDGSRRFHEPLTLEPDQPTGSFAIPVGSNFESLSLHNPAGVNGFIPAFDLPGFLISEDTPLAGQAATRAGRGLFRSVDHAGSRSNRRLPCRDVHDIGRPDGV